MNIIEKFSLKEKIAVVTGGARGIGFGMATGLAEAGAKVILADYDIDGAEITAKGMRDKGLSAFAVQLDVSKRESCEKAVNSIIRDFNKIDILINNAGINCHAPFENMSLEDWNRVLAVNLDGVFNMSQLVGQQMLNQGKGSIINIASINGIVATSPQTISSYNASKGAVIMLTRSLAVEWAKKGIRVNAIAPGFVETELTKKKWNDENSDFVKLMLSKIPMGRRASTDELAPLALFLASDASSYATGAVYIYDGGYTAI